MRTLILTVAALIAMSTAAQSYTILSYDIDVEAGVLDLAVTGLAGPATSSDSAECGGISVSYLSATSSNTGRLEPDGPRNEIILTWISWPTNMARASHDLRFNLDENTYALVTAELQTIEGAGMQSDLLCRLWNVDTGEDFVNFDGRIEHVVNPYASLSEERFLAAGNYGYACEALIVNQSSLEDDFSESNAVATGFFDIALIPVPEPAVPMSMAAGVVFLAAVRRSRGH